MIRKLNLRMLPVIFALAWPTMLEQLMQTAVQYIDTAMVGSLGTDATAAVGSTTTVNWLVGSSVSSLCDLMENERQEIETKDGKIELDFKGFEIITLKLI